MSLYLGNTPIAGSGYDKANTDLDNLTSTGKNIANWSDNVSNCITEIPQDIKLELNNGTLTLKAGSKVYVPNGAGVFDTVTISSDITVSPNNGEKLFFLHPNGTQIYHANISNQIYSGTTQPSITYGFWYDTTNNVVKFTSNGSTWTSGFSLPLAKGSNTSIDQVFNGFGYIGSTVFALPGVKGLIPSGRNEDGTLKNIEFSYTSVTTLNTVSASGDFEIYSISNVLAQTATVSYHESENFNIDVSGEQVLACKSINISTDSTGKVTSFQPKTAFHALDWNDKSIISGWSMPSSRYINLTLGASGATYTAPANGWFSVSKKPASNGQTLWLYNQSKKFGVGGTCYGTSIERRFLPVQKGDVIDVTYSLSGNTDNFRFYYAEGEN